MPTSHKPVETIPQSGFLGHPKGLFTLFFTEFWERFSYYGMRAILLYYMYYELHQGGLGIDEKTANSILALYGSLVYMSSVLGGWLADRIFGMRRTVFYGGVLIMLGHIVLALPGGIHMLFGSMALIVLGSGLLKPGIPAMVGDLYTLEDARRDSAFSLLYTGINLGSFLAPLIVGYVGQTYNFHLGFGIAAVGMALGLLVYLVTQNGYLGSAGKGVRNPLESEERGRLVFFLLAAVLLASLGAGLLVTGWLTFDRFAIVIAVFGVLIPIGYFALMYFSRKTSEIEKSRVLAFIPLFLASVMFFAILEQGASVLGTYADKRADLDLGSFQIPPAWFQSLNPLFVITLAPAFAWLWLRLGKRQPSTPVKFSFSLFFAGLSFLVMVIPALGSADEKVNPLWLVLSFFLVVIGELLLAPIGLSVATKLAPKAFGVQMVSLLMLANAMAQAINAQVVKLFNAENEALYFGALGCLSIAFGLVLLLFTPMIKRAMRGAE